ncbi:MAG: glycoside hydrolase family 3 protein [Phycisphaerales bacterium]|nr:glycoside hydrolase family 3 protein [Phycisphaerales bacterium]
MNLAELAGACIMTGFCGATLDDPQCRADVQLLKDLHIKGVILFDTHLPTGGMRNIVSEDQVRQLTENLRNELGDDLIIGIDQEGGQVNRLSLFQDNAVSEQLSAKMQGAMSQHQLSATIEPVAKALSDAGINLNFAPCVDLAINPDNPIIAGKGRSMGRDPDRVVKAAMTIVQTYHDHGVGCCIKHYPGHGSTTVDTHLGLADMTQTHTHDETEVFSTLIQAMHSQTMPIAAIMSGHLIDKRIDPDHPASLSHAHINTTLRSKHNFDGLIFTDSLDMNAIESQWNAGEASKLAILSGADIAVHGFNAHDQTDHPATQMHRALHKMLEHMDPDVAGKLKATNLRRRQSMFQ